MNAYLIVGLGNPGILYEKTRHNFGFRIIGALAKKYKIEFKKEKKFESKIASGEILNKNVYLLMPLTYMNKSGIALEKVVNYYKFDIENILVVVDDADIKFGEFKLKKDSSSAGHKGLQSIEEHLNTQKYTRLKIGIGRESRALKTYVLDKFTKQEKEKLPEIEKKAISYLELWLEKGFQLAANQVNVRIKNKKNHEEKNG